MPLFHTATSGVAIFHANSLSLSVLNHFIHCNWTCPESEQIVYFDYDVDLIYTNILKESNLILDFCMHNMDKSSLLFICLLNKSREKGTMEPFNNLLQHSSICCSVGQDTVILSILGFKCNI
jgi:hypothetical protein